MTMAAFFLCSRWRMASGKVPSTALSSRSCMRRPCGRLRSDSDSQGCRRCRIHPIRSLFLKNGRSDCLSVVKAASLVISYLGAWLLNFSFFPVLNPATPLCMPNAVPSHFHNMWKNTRNVTGLGHLISCLLLDILRVSPLFITRSHRILIFCQILWQKWQTHFTRPEVIRIWIRANANVVSSARAPSSEFEFRALRGDDLSVVVRVAETLAKRDSLIVNILAIGRTFF